MSAFTCRVLNHMRDTGQDIALPELSDKEAKAAEVVFDFSSGYVQRALSYLPQNGLKDPWRLNQDYLHDKHLLLHGPVADSVLRFARAGTLTVQQNRNVELAPLPMAAE